MARLAIKIMQLAPAFLALTLAFVSGSPMSRNSGPSSAAHAPGKSPDIINLSPAPTPALGPSHVNSHVVQQSAPPQETGGDGTIYIARDDTEAVYPRQQGPTGCIIYIARDGKVGTTAPPGGCPSPPAQEVRNLRLPPQETKSSIFRVEDHLPAHNQVQRDVEHKPTFTTLISPGLITLTVSASTGRETGGVVVITRPVTEKSHKTDSSKTNSWDSPGTFTVTGVSGTFTVITTFPSHPEHTHRAGRIPPPEWLSTRVKTHVRPTDKPVPTEPAHLAGRVPPPEWLSAHTRDHPYTGNYVRPTDKPFAWRSPTSAKSTTHIHTMDKHTYTWKHKSETELDTTHVRPTDKPATWGQTTTESGYVRPTDKPVAWGLEERATRPTTHIHTMDKHTYSWKHKTNTELDPTHVRPTDKPATWGLETSTEDPTHVRPTGKPATWGLDGRDNIPTGIPTSFRPAPSPSCTLTVNDPIPTMKGNVKTVHASTTTVTQYHVCGGCLLVTGQPQTLDRKWEATKTVRGVKTVTVDKCTGGRRRPTHGTVR
ncbi:hypothetical protein DL98DRAFT_659649 [Cadophora sp. DSE1049]|nr:hypothetical protein DL98DRAFT_659649 [Cadophora sp. DSE1049]